MASVASESDWVDGTEAARILGVPDARSVTALASDGLIQSRNLPRTYRRFRKSDCEKLARNSLVTASEPPR